MGGCQVAAVGLTVAFLGWLQLPQSLPETLSYQPPGPTPITQHNWSGTKWPEPYPISQKDRDFFHKAGFLIMRGFLAPFMVNRLLLMHDKWCPGGAYSPHWHCKNEDVWARTDIYRDFLYHGPIGPTVQRLLQVPGVRIYGDHVTEMRQQHKGIFYHFDNVYYGGVLGEFRNDTKGAIVFVFLTHVDKNTTGGSVLLEAAGHKSDCVRAGLDPARQAECREQFYKKAFPLHFKPGDALVLHPLMPHASQNPLASAPADFRRVSYLARLVEADAVYCATDQQVRETGKVDCRHSLRPGDKAHHVCYQQITPLIKEEVKQRVSFTWYRETCNIHPDWRYSGRKRLELWASGLLSQLRIRLSGREPVGLERAECTHPPAAGAGTNSWPG